MQEKDNTKFNFWQDHSRNYLEMAFSADKRETLENPDGYGKITGECGDAVEIFLIVKNSIIEHAAFNTNGCTHSVACGNTVVNMAEGKTTDQAWQISPESIIDFLETLPEHEYHCADRAAAALRLAIADLTKMRQEPWQKIYGRE